MRILTVLGVWVFLLGSVSIANESEFTSDQFKKTNPLYGMLVGAGTVSIHKPVLRPFATDGCSLSPNTSIDWKRLGDGQKPNLVDFAECCVQHDVAYWLGGTQEQKVLADQEFRQCVTKKAGDEVASLYFNGVSIGGTADAFNTFRWAYGWNTLRPYGPITAAEMAQAETLYGKDLVRLHELVANKNYELNLELVTLDFAGTNIWHDDIIVYSTLQNILKRQDVVTFGQKLYYRDRKLYYAIGLKSCGQKLVYVALNRAKMLRDVLHLRDTISSMSAEQLKVYVDQVIDPDQCLM